LATILVATSTALLKSWARRASFMWSSLEIGASLPITVTYLTSLDASTTSALASLALLVW
jgi:hypothetical protein